LLRAIKLAYKADEDAMVAIPQILEDRLQRYFEGIFDLSPKSISN
jgi:hypothetical protein